MATQTTHFDMVKQQSAEHVSVGLLNDNFDIIDQVMYNNQEKSEQLADEYNAGTTYNVGDYVRRENYIYKCNTASTTGVWDSTKWDRVKIADELGGGGGSSTFAGLNDVNVTGVQNGDIARYNSTTGKWEASDDLTDLELSVSQLSSSVLNIAGEVDTLELTVSQMSASTLPYDVNTNIKQKIDNVESSIPTNASELPYSSTASTEQAIQNLAKEFRYHKGDTMVFGGGNYMLAGRTGWSGKQFYFGIPLPKVLGNDVTGATISVTSGGSIYGVSYNQAVAFHTLSRTDNIIGVAPGRTTVAWEMAFQTAPLSITDGIVNLMVNSAVTITFT